MTPIEKNVRVVDEQGNEYEATYPKRAKGLVKNGRARFTAENTICLACPPDVMKEDIKMSDIEEIKANEETGEVIESKGTAQKHTLDYALGQLEKVRNDSLRFAEETREKIGSIRSGGPGDVGAQAAGEAMAELIREQGELYRKLTDFYIGMIYDLKKEVSGAEPVDRKQFLDFVIDCAGASHVMPDIKEIWKLVNE